MKWFCTRLDITYIVGVITMFMSNLVELTSKILNGYLDSLKGPLEVFYSMVVLEVMSETLR